MSRKLLTFWHLHKGTKLGLYRELAMLKILDDVSKMVILSMF